MCVGGSCRATSSLVVPGYWVKALLMARQGSVGLASQSIPCSSNDDQKTAAFKTKFTAKSKSRAFLHAKSKTRLACWNVQSAISALSLKLQHIIETMTVKNIDLLALSESCWHAGSWNLLKSSPAPFFIPALTLHTPVE